MRITVIRDRSRGRFIGAFSLLVGMTLSLVTLATVPPAEADPIPASSISIGSYPATVNTQQTAVLNVLLGTLGSASVTALEYQGLANTYVSVNQLITASGGLLTTSNVMTTSLPANDWQTIWSDAVANQLAQTNCTSSPLLCNASTALTSGLSFSGGVTTEVELCQLVSVNGSSCSNGSLSTYALNANLNALQTLTTEAEVTNGSNPLNVQAALSITGVTAATLSLSLVRPPQVAYGPVGSSTTASPCPVTAPATSTCATTAQVSSDLQLTVAGQVLDIPLSAAVGYGTLSQVTCSNNVFQNAKINVSTTAATGAVTLAGLNIASLTISGVSNKAGSYGTVPPTSSSVSLGTNPRTFGTTSPLFAYSSLSSGSPVYTLLTSTLPPVLGPVLQTTGASIGGAQAADLSTNCGDTLTFNSEGGSAVADVSGLDGATVTLPAAPIFPGYTFTGWNTSSDGSGTNYAAGATYSLTGSITLYAQWTPNATDTLTFNSEGGSGVGDVSGLDGTTVTLPAAPILSGYTFHGWNTAADGSGTNYAAGSTYTLTGSIPLYAQWTAGTAPVVTTPPLNQSYIVGQTLTFTAAATGTPNPTVEWQISFDGGSTWTNLSGDTSDSLTTGALDAFENGWEVRAVFTNLVSSTPSAAAAMTLRNTAPTVTTQPNSQSYVVGQALTFTAAATGTPNPTVEWQLSTDGGTSWSNLSADTSDSLTTGALDAFENGWEVRAVFTNLVSSTPSNAATMTLTNPTTVVLPANGATLSGTQSLDATALSGVTKVQYELSGNGLTDQIIGTGTATIYGWFAAWNTTTVPNGTYSLQSVASGATNGTSSAVTITVANPAPTTSVALPSNNATLSGSQYLDATATSGVTQVQYEVTGEGLSDDVVATATPTVYGWFAAWNTTTVPNGTYTLQSVASYAGGVTGTSMGTTITVAN